MGKHRNHVLIGVTVEMVSLVTPIENIGHVVWWRRIDDGRRDDISHVAMVSVFWYLQLRV